MRNDARPIGHEAPHSAVRNPESAEVHDATGIDPQLDIVNRQADESSRHGDEEIDPVMPAGDSTLNTKI